MQPRLLDLVIMHHMCIQSMPAYEKHRDAERRRGSESTPASAGDGAKTVIIHSTWGTQDLIGESITETPF